MQHPIEKSISKSNQMTNPYNSQISENDLLFPRVKRGEIYLCDFGEPFGCEQGKKRYALVVQNNTGNNASPTTIVLACTSRQKPALPVHYKFVLSRKNMKDYNERRIGKELKCNTILAEQIRTVDKRRLRSFIGTMTEEFMDEVQPIIDISLDLKRKEKVIFVNPTKDLDIVQIQLLGKVNIEKVLEISKTIEPDQIRIKRILKLFGFEPESEGVQYLTKAIYIATKANYFALEPLCETLAKEENITLPKEKIEAIITTTIRKQFDFEKNVAIAFIRLARILLTKQPIPEIK